ncbi:MAG TPA: transglycosylase domain-containing protein, partial [Beijerinckiaceae bacterium]|nr:transglycosylase domain-containing protein [Beijerinckiaceae bacterium]
EGVTLGLGGAALLLALALPAFQYTTDDWLKKQDLAVTFLDRYGQEVGKRGIRHDDSVPLDQYPDYLIQAVLATEDRRFYDHWGIDPIGTLRALTVDAGSSGVVEGGSSITQQLAKNLFLTNERTVERKLKEAFLAFWLESHLQKREILQLYLDRAYMGGGTFGIQAAAEFYFGKNIRDVSLAEAAMLAGLFKAPTKYAPHINLPAARARANDVLSNLVDAGYMTEGQVYAARQNPATPIDRERESSPDWYLDWAFDQVKELVDAGKLGDNRVLTVRTALDSALQEHAESAIEDALRVSGPRWRAKQAATVVLEPNGAVRAIVGGRDYGESQFNRATEAERQPGSSFKPFVYLTALKTGRFNDHSIVDASALCIGNWCPGNYGGESAGRIPIGEALAKSINTAAVWLSIKIGEAYWPRGQSYYLARIAQLGRSKIVETAKAMGITTPLPDTVSLPIGADVVKPIDMASAYSVFAAGGKRSPPYAVVEARNSRGDVIYSHDRDAPPPVQVEPADKVIQMVSLMNQVVQSGTGRAAQLDGITVAGKTGTTNNSRDAWFIGYTGNYVAAVWFGNDDFTAMNGMTGGTLPAATWHNIMAYAHQGIELKPLPGFTTPQGPAKVAANSGSGDLGAPHRPVTLSHKSVAALGDIEQLFHSADQKRQLGLGPVTSPVTLAAGGAARDGVGTMQ